MKISNVAIKWSQEDNPPMMDPCETDLLIRYIKKCKKHFVEIGTYKGGSAALISKYLSKNIKLTTIDIFDNPPKGSIPPSKTPATYGEAKKTITKKGNIEKVRIIKGVSWNIAKKWKRKIDFLFIDGDHRYQGFKRDFENWEPNVIVRGFILVHDTNFPGIAKAIKEILKQKRFLLKEKSGNLIVIKKLK